jgi:hypothetical protein
VPDQHVLGVVKPYVDRHKPAPAAETGQLAQPLVGEGVRRQGREAVDPRALSCPWLAARIPDRRMRGAFAAEVKCTSIAMTRDVR